MAHSFTVSGGSVYWNALLLSEQQADHLLDFFEELGDQPEARAAFIDLYAAHMAAGGIERCTSLRLVSRARPSTQHAAE